MAHDGSIEGIVNQHYRFRYTTKADVLSIHLDESNGLVTQGELTPGGDTLLRDQKSGRPVALTVKDFWKRHGNGQPADHTPATQQHIEQYSIVALAEAALPKP